MGLYFRTLLYRNRTIIYPCTDIRHDWLQFKEDQFEEDGELILAMKEINQRRKDLEMTDDEWVAVWMLGNIKKRRKIDKYVYQALRNVVKEGGVDVLKNFETKLEEMRVEGCRRLAQGTYRKCSFDRRQRFVIW